MAEANSRSKDRKLPQRFVLLFLLFVSGFCGISYEVLYARILSDLVGDRFVVSASVLMAFLLGIGLGTLYAHRLWRYLFALEAGIGFYGLALATGSGALDSLIYSWAPLSQNATAVVIACLALLFIPAFLIGCSLPLFAGYLSRAAQIARSERVFARAYFFYNLGAALTVLLVEFWLLRALGVRISILLLASMNVAIAIWLRFGFRALREVAPHETERATFPTHQLTALALASVASGAFQLLAFKLAECFIGPFHETFALVLTLVLLGIALGTAVAEKLRLQLSHLMAVCVIGLVWLLAGFEPVTHLYASLYHSAAASHPLLVLLKLGSLGLLIGIPAMAMGATVPVLMVEQKHVARECGQLLFISSLANAGGFLLMVFVLHRHLDYGAIVVVIALLALLSLVVYRRRITAGMLAVSVSLLLATGAAFWRWDETYLYLGHLSFTSTDRLDALRPATRYEAFKSHRDVFALVETESDGTSTGFFINGYYSFTFGSPNEYVVGALSSILAPRNDDALVLGLGSGVSAGTVGLLFDKSTAIEINPAVVENLHQMSKWNFDIERNPRVSIALDDGIHFLKTSTERYSMILNTVTSPLYFSSSKLYTRDFFEIVRDHLKPDGIYVTWVDNRVQTRGLDIILKTLSNSFTHCWAAAIAPDYFLLICSEAELRVHQPDLIAKNPTLSKHFLREHAVSPAWIAYSLVSTNAFLAIADQRAPLNTLDRPVLEFAMASLRESDENFLNRRFEGQLNLVTAAAVFGPVTAWDPVHLGLHREAILGEQSPLANQWDELARSQLPDYRQRKRDALFDHSERVAATGSSNGILRYAELLIQRGDHQKALAQLRQFTEHPLPPTIAFQAFLQRGTCYEALGQLGEAHANYVTALKLQPSSHEIRDRLLALQEKRSGKQ